MLAQLADLSQFTIGPSPLERCLVFGDKISTAENATKDEE
jgi:hypothetical protein